jgi:hypothetical protein
MARSCLCQRWLTRAAADLGFQALPAAAQLLFFRLLASASNAEERGLVRFPVPVSVAVSRILNRSETEAETDLAMLVELGWVEMEPDGRSLWIAGAKGQAGRSKAAQVNGLRGGRPRKDETPEQARQRRQGSLMLPIAGGPEKPTETEREPNGESSRAAAASSSAVKEAAAAAGARASWVSLAERCAQIAGIDPARGGWNALPVKGWVDAGVPEDVILETVRTVSARPRAKPIGSLMFFHQAVMEAKACTPVPGRPSVVDGYREALREWQHSGAQGVPPSLAEWQAEHAA